MAEVSSEKRTPAPVSFLMSATAFVPALLIVWVAPSSRASASRLSCTSTALIGSQPATLAAIRPDRPTAPTPNTAKESPGLGCMLLNTAPAPVCPLPPRGPHPHGRKRKGTAYCSIHRGRAGRLRTSRSRQRAPELRPAADRQ